MASPYQKEVQIEIKDKLALPYVEMTLQLMLRFGCRLDINKNFRVLEYHTYPYKVYGR